MKLWLLQPGYIASRNDRDRHYVGERDLCRLYGVNRDECVRMNDGGQVRGMSKMVQDQLVRLSPQYFSDAYTLPFSRDEQIARMEKVLAAKERMNREARWVGISIKDDAGNIIGRVVEVKLAYHPDAAQIVCEVEPSFARYLTNSTKGSFSVGQ